MTKVLVCGSRGWHDPVPMNALLAGLAFTADANGEKLTVIHGDAPGADRLADRLARQWGATVIREPAEWDLYGRSAGPIRNQKMLNDHTPDVVYAFRSSGKSSGTDDMVNRAKAHSVPVYVVQEG